MRLPVTRRLVQAISLILLSALPAVADSRVERELPLDPGGRLVVEVDGMSVEVRGTDRPGAFIVIESREDLEERYDLRFEHEPGEVRVVVKKRRKGWSWFGDLFSSSRGANVEIRIPSRTEVEVRTSGGSIDIAAVRGDGRLDTSGGSISVADHEGAIEADTSGGSIQLQDIRGSARAETSGGSIRAAGIRGDLVADTSGGGIAIHDVGGDIVAETSGGSIEIDGAAGRVRANTSGGSIEVVFASGNDRGGELETSGGNIRVRIDPRVNLTLDASATSGVTLDGVTLRVRGDVRKNHLDGDLGEGGQTLRIETSGGSIRVLPLES